MNISILIPTYKRIAILTKTLEGFCDLNVSTIDWEILLVDNAGDPETRNVVKKFQNKIPIKYLIETNPGKNHALNLGLRHTKGELIVFTDDDIKAEKMWLI